MIMHFENSDALLLAVITDLMMVLTSTLIASNSSHLFYRLHPGSLLPPPLPLSGRGRQQKNPYPKYHKNIK